MTLYVMKSWWVDLASRGQKDTIEPIRGDIGHHSTIQPGTRPNGVNPTQ